MKSKSMRLFLFALPGLAFACQPALTSRMSGTGGTNGSAGAGGGTAGSGSGTAGSTGVAGTTGAAGDNSTAGTTGTAGSMAGTTGAAGGAAGAVGTDGGAAGAGGAAGGTAGGAGGEDIMGVLGKPNKYNNMVADSFIMFPCYMNSAQDCITNKPGTQCPAQVQGKPFEEQGIVLDQDFQVGGTPGKMYTATIQVTGITEGKIYENGTRAAGETNPVPNADSDMGTDTFYTGGDPVPVGNYNVYEIRSKDMSGKDVQHYYLNSFPRGNTTYETHTTFAINYSHDIMVMGGGTITYHSSDLNCHAIDNCGSGYRTVTCAVSDGRKVPNDPNLVVPTTYLGEPVSQFNARNGAAQPFHSHLIHIRVTAIK